MPVKTICIEGKVKGAPKREGEGNYWDLFGMKLFIGEYEGNPTYSVVDSRYPDRVIKFFPPQDDRQPGSDDSRGGGGGGHFR